MDLPAALAVAAQPLKRARTLRVRRSPAGSECEIDAAVTVDVVRLDADIIAGSRAANDVVLAPARVLVPDHRVLGHDHDVELTIAVHVGRRDRVADLAGMRVDLLRLKSGKVGSDGGQRVHKTDKTHDDVDTHENLQFARAAKGDT